MARPQVGTPLANPGALGLPGSPVGLPVHDPLAGFGAEHSYAPSGERAANERVAVATRGVDSAQLRPVGDPGSRPAWNRVPLLVRPYWPWLAHRLNGLKLIAGVGAQSAQPQEMEIPATIIRGDTFRVEPEPWATQIPPIGA